GRFAFFFAMEKEGRRPQAAKSPAKLPKETRRNTMIHLYCGDGKGKTTAAMGLALRMAGRGKPVVIAQFLKGAASGERYALSLLPKVTLLPAPEQIKFSFQLTPEERTAEQKRYLRLIAQARTAAREIPEGLLVLDEVCAAVNTGLLPLEEVLNCLE